MTKRPESKKTISKAVDTSSDYQTIQGIEKREKQLLDKIKTKTGFVVKENIWRSSYWGSETIGAANYLGTYNDRPAVLKIQGAKPALSEVDVLDAFTQQNNSKVIRTAKLYDKIRWSEADQYEALIMEHVTGDKVLTSKKPTTATEVSEFLKFYQEYRKNCRNKPWLQKPETAVDVNQVIKKLSDARENIHPNHPLRLESDDILIQDSASILRQYFTLDNLEFVHGHLSAEDIFRLEGKEEYVIFSNLFWGWKPPFYDLIFAHHWLIYGLANHPDTDMELIKKQRQLWVDAMSNLDAVKKNPQGFKLALLERATAGLILDSLAYTDPSNPISKLLVEFTRNQVKELVQDLK